MIEDTNLNDFTLYRISKMSELYLWHYYFSNGGIDYGVMMRSAPSKENTEFILNTLKDKDIKNGDSVSLVVGLKKK